MSTHTQPVLLELRDVSKSFGATIALANVDFELRRGEIHAVCGENGAGKSTLIKIMAGVIRPDVGTLSVDGKVIENSTPRLSLTNGIATIYQENALFQHLSVAENIFVGHEPRRASGIVDHQHMKQAAAGIFQRLGVEIDVTAKVATLGGATQKIVEIGRAFRQQARVLIMDEPSASFGHHETRLLFNAVREVAASGTGVIFISHHLEEVFEIADRVTVIRDGRKISTADIADVDEASLIRDMVGRDVSQIFRRRPHAAGAVALETRDLGGPGFQHVTITVRKGEVVGIAGLVGAGRSELLETIFGRFRATCGETLINGRRTEITSPLDAMRAGMCLVTEDRKLNGLFLRQSVAANLAVPLFSKFPRWLVNAGKLRAAVADTIRRFAIKVASPDTPVLALSGGNQQKVVLGKWMLTTPDVIMLDEPTRGIDVGAKAEIYGEIQKLVEAGKSVLMVSSELPEVIGLSDRVYVMKAGRMVKELSGPEINQHRILELAL